MIGFAELEERIGVNPTEEFTAVIQDFVGPFGGTAMLLYSATESLELVRALLREESASEELPVLQADALREVGNVVLNASLGGIGQMLNTSFETGLPALKSGHCQEIFADGAGHSAGHELLYMRMRFALSAPSVAGQLGFSLDMRNGDALQTCLSDFLKTMGGA
jgi:chemotaxis protein CheC